jgi:energy-coupling factor transport system permease protein
MIKNITIGQYVPGNSAIHRMDPRAKILMSFFFIFIIFLINKFSGYIFIAGLLLTVVTVSKLQLRYLYKGLKPIFLLLIITAMLNLFMTTGGEILFQWRFIRIYQQGLRTAVFMVLRLVFLIMSTSVLTLTTSPIELTDGIEYLLNPLKKIGVPAHELAMMMTIALRFIPTLMDETDKIMKAQMARGADFESGNIIAKAKSLIPLLVPLIISSFRRAEELAMAMEARCYRGGEGRTRMKVLRYTTVDAMGFVIFLVFAAAAIATRSNMLIF